LDAAQVYRDLLGEMRKHISGQEQVIELMIISIVANGHALLEGVPGLAKTTMTKALANAIQADFKRIQGTNDLEPKDILGYTYVDSDNETKFNKGPVFTNILLVDELNRTPPKTMSALLETLEERQVTVEGTSMPLMKPFVAFATQNPLTIEGTTPIPKVLADRFLLKISVDYSTTDEEKAMLRLKEKEETVEVKKIIDTSGIIELQEAAKGVVLPDQVVSYITSIVGATRKDIHSVMGASPRAEISFMQAGKAKAMLEGRSEVSKDDIKFLARPVLSHRIVVRATGGIGVHGIIDGIIASVD